MQYISIKKVAELLDVTLGIARNWCNHNNIRAIALGTGRGRGMRYLLADIEFSLESQSICMGKIQETEQKKPKIPKDRPFYRRSRQEQIALVLNTKLQ